MGRGVVSLASVISVTCVVGAKVGAAYETGEHRRGECGYCIVDSTGGAVLSATATNGWWGHWKSF